jgi:hypothetical protein
MNAFTPVEVNTSFSTVQKNLQLYMDSTSLGALKKCARYYQLNIIEGWVSRDDNIHLVFGAVYHKALETYDHIRAAGGSYDAGVLAAVRASLLLSWDFIKDRPLAVFCQDSNKNRETLIRSVVWYLDKFREDALETVILENGKPAVELSFRYKTTYVAPTGEPFFLCGHLDRLARFGDGIWIADRKTTKMTIGEYYFQTFTPDNQMTGYALAGKVVYNTPTAGVIIDAAQIAVSFTRFQRGFAPRTDDQLTEWYEELEFWLVSLAAFARANRWPMNDKACWGCGFRGICSHDPKVRQIWLRSGFTKRMWDPLQIRGDI